MLSSRPHLAFLPLAEPDSPIYQLCSDDSVVDCRRTAGRESNSRHADFQLIWALVASFAGPRANPGSARAGWITILIHDFDLTASPLPGADTASIPPLRVISNTVRSIDHDTAGSVFRLHIGEAYRFGQDLDHKLYVSGGAFFAIIGNRSLDRMVHAARLPFLRPRKRTNSRIESLGSCYPRCISGIARPYARYPESAHWIVLRPVGPRA
jgi:hypothetical protein